MKCFQTFTADRVSYASLRLPELEAYQILALPIPRDPMVKSRDQALIHLTNKNQSTTRLFQEQSRCHELSEVPYRPVDLHKYDILTKLITGVLVECDPSIKSIIVKIDSENHAFIVEELDDQHLVIKENMLGELKSRLEDVGPCPWRMLRSSHCFRHLRRHSSHLRILVLNNETSRKTFLIRS
jgi:TFIIH basal transcription factor complex TTD-A subunit